MRKSSILWKLSVALVVAAVPLALSVHTGCGGSSGGGGGGGGNPDAGGVGGNPDAGGTPDSGSGGGLGSATVNGTVRGASLRAVSSLGVATGLNCPEGSFSLALGGIVDYAVSCSSLQGNKANSTQLLLNVFRTGAQAQQPIAAGTYTVGAITPDPSGNITFAGATFEKLNATCGSAIGPVEATGGTIVISSLTSSRITGTFDLNFPNGDRLTGTFDAAICSLPTLTCSALLDGGTGTPPDAGCTP